ncbi:MAG: calcium-binding protein [Rhodobiaceae bacterium]|nr:calcium-binding protein [Rhodobiaceae bacterium]
MAIYEYWSDVFDFESAALVSQSASRIVYANGILNSDGTHTADGTFTVLNGTFTESVATAGFDQGTITSIVREGPLNTTLVTVTNNLPTLDHFTTLRDETEGLRSQLDWFYLSEPVDATFSATRYTLEFADGTFAWFNGTGLPTAPEDGDIGSVTSVEHRTAGGVLIPADTVDLSSNPKSLGYLSSLIFYPGTIYQLDLFDSGQTFVSSALSGDEIDMHGGAGNDTFTGSAADDHMQGEGGSDTATGGGGSDSFHQDIDGYVNFNGGSDADPDELGVTNSTGTSRSLQLVPYDTGNPSAFDILAKTPSSTPVAYGVDVEVFSFSMGDQGDTFTVSGDFGNTGLSTLYVFGGDGNDTVDLYGQGLFVIVSGGLGNDTITDSAGIPGQASLNGDEGVDTITANSNFSTVFGGEGDDILISNAAGATLSYISAPGAVTVNLSTNTVSGGDGNDVISGFRNVSGSDLFGDHLTGNAFANTIGGKGGADTLIGLAGNDILIGGAGIDTMIGGTDDDTYNVEETGDIVSEAPGEGTDLVEATATFTLPDNVENLTLKGSGVIDGFGNGLANVLIGNFQSNLLVGGGGADVIDGKQGADTMVGGPGDDIFIVDDTGDTVSDGAGEGTDQVNSYVGFTLFANLEHLSLLGTSHINAIGNDLNNNLFGNSGNNTLDGLAGADTMIGGLGNDIYVVDDVGDSVSDSPSGGTDQVNSYVSFTLFAYLENLSLLGTANINAIGNSENNILIGNAGNNTLDGLAGADTMVGNAGDDIFVVDNVGDTVSDLASGGGTDQVNSSVSFALVDHIENLSLLGSGNINAIGNALANVLIGNSGNNTLDGLGGADTMVGNGGDDIYVVDNAGDIVSESPGGGTDQVNSSVSFVLFANIENLSLLGSGNINATGNELANTLIGNSGSNVFLGNAGNDLMIGNGGNDTFVFGDGCDDDTITDFSGGAGLGDQLNVAAFGFADFAAVQAVTTDTAGGALIQLDSDDSVTLQGVLKADLVEDDFILV